MDHLHAGFQMPGVAAPPPLMNQPPQIFGGYHEPGMQLHQLPPELTAQMFGDPGTFLDDANEAKRRRIARVSRPARFTDTSPHNSILLYRLLTCVSFFFFVLLGLRYV